MYIVRKFRNNSDFMIDLSVRMTLRWILSNIIWLRKIAINNLSKGWLTIASLHIFDQYIYALHSVFYDDN